MHALVWGSTRNTLQKKRDITWIPIWSGKKGKDV